MVVKTIGLKCFPKFRKIFRPKLAFDHCWLIYIPYWSKLKNFHIPVSLSIKPFANICPIVAHPLASHTSVQIRYKLERNLYLPFPNSFHKLPRMDQQSVQLGQHHQGKIKKKGIFLNLRCSLIHFIFNYMRSLY